MGTTIINNIESIRYNGTVGIAFCETYKGVLIFQLQELNLQCAELNNFNFWGDDFFPSPPTPQPPQGEKSVKLAFPTHISKYQSDANSVSFIKKKIFSCCPTKCRLDEPLSTTIRHREGFQTKVIQLFETI